MMSTKKTTRYEEYDESEDDEAEYDESEEYDEEDEEYDDDEEEDDEEEDLRAYKKKKLLQQTVRQKGRGR